MEGVEWPSWALAIAAAGFFALAILNVLRLFEKATKLLATAIRTAMNPEIDLLRQEVRGGMKDIYTIKMQLSGEHGDSIRSIMVHTREKLDRLEEAYYRHLDEHHGR